MTDLVRQYDRNSYVIKDTFSLFSNIIHVIIIEKHLSEIIEEHF